MVFILGLGGFLSLDFAYGWTEYEVYIDDQCAKDLKTCNDGCVQNYMRALDSCQKNPSSDFVAQCRDRVGVENSISCASNKCMQTRYNYPDGMSTNIAQQCQIDCHIKESCAKQREAVKAFDVSAPGEEVVGPVPVQRRQPTPASDPLDPSKVPIPQARPNTPKPQQGPPAPQQQVQQQPPQHQPPPSPSTSTSTAQWPQESSNDIQQCTGYQSQASLCCNKPESCSSELSSNQKDSYLQAARIAESRGDITGLQQACRQSKMASLSSSNVNTGFANICFSKHSACSQSCGSHLAKWQNRLNNCSGDCDRSLVEQTISSLQGKRQQCQGYANLESRIRSQVYASADDAAMSRLCEKHTSYELSSDDNRSRDRDGGGLGFDPSSLGGGNPPSQKALEREEVKKEMEVCKANPNAPGCYTAPMFEGESVVSNMNAQTNPSVGVDDFNVAASEHSKDGFGTTFDGNSSANIQMAAARGHAIPNGGGGFGGGQLNQPSGGSDLPAMLGSGVNPNILQEGTVGGSGYSQSYQRNSGSGFEFRSQFGSFGSQENSNVQSKNYKGLDLKKFLPGGDKDPRRDLAGVSEFYPDIGPKHIDFFQRVSSRLQTLCKLKRLLDCQ